MKRLSPPKITFNEMLVKCSEGMRQPKIRERFISTFKTFHTKEQKYKELSTSGTLYTYPKTKNLTNTTPVIEHLTKTTLVNLYENNLRNKKKPARNYYDSLLVSSGERCPFCGEIGQTKNLDHFLPKAHFPEFSVMPINLVPSCRDCNMGEKGQNYATKEGDQPIHPYLDKDIFFNHQWIYANYINEGEGAVIYYIECPTTWSQEEKNRAKNHFINLDLANRYALEAGKHLSEVIDQKKNFMKILRKLGGTEPTKQQFKNEFIEAFFEPITQSDTFHNQWKKVMYQCLTKSETFFQD